jgi:hypothetical protein
VRLLSVKNSVSTVDNEFSQLVQFSIGRSCRFSVIAAIRLTGVTEYPACRSFGLDVGCPDYFGPLFSFGL